MKQNLLTLSIAFILSLTLSITAKASHCVGAYITYVYTGNPNEYVVQLHYYRDCAGMPGPSIGTICYSSASLGLSGTFDIYPIPGTGNVVSFTACSGSSINCSVGLGIEEWIFADTVVLPQPANDWIFAYAICCRNAAIMNLANPAGYGLFVSTTLDNLNAPANNSPVFVDSMINQYCVNYFSNINYHCIDADGDSLVYSLIPVQDASGFCPLTPAIIAYNPPYTATNPLLSSTPIVFDVTTGILGFTPSAVQVNQVCVKIDEYRNGILIGSVRRDDQVMCVNGVANPDLIKGKVFNDNNFNGVKDSNETVKAGAILIEQPDNIYATTNSNGDYTVPVNIGSYSVMLASPPKYSTMVPDSNFATFTTLGYTDSLNDFAIQIDTNILDLSLSASWLPSNIPCDTLNFTLNLNNVGGTVASGLLYLTMDTAINVIGFNIQPDSISGNNFWWNVDSMLPGAYTTFVISYAVNCGTPFGTVLMVSAVVTTTQPDDYINDNSLWGDINTVSSYDPNIKSVNHNVISPSFVANREWLVYTIQFQNTGNAPATNIVITDTIRYTLDAGSFELLGSSHACTFNLYGNGIVDFNFNNIYLPDSFSNEPASHGYVQYRIKPKVNLPVGQMILNTAHIFFDNNPAIVTNTTHTYVTNVTAVNQINNGLTGVEVYPNPFNSSFTLKLNNLNVANLELLDVTGRMLLKKQITNSETIDMNKFSKGIYIYRVFDNNGSSCIGRLIKN